jgi:uncharacterized protein YqeY
MKETILAQLKEAMKSGDKSRVTILRTLHAAIKQVEIDTQKELTDEEVQQVVQRQVKQLQDAITDFSAGGRTDLVEQNLVEIDILSTFLPEQLSDEALLAVVEEVVADHGIDTPFGQLMGAVMKQVSGKADGNRVRATLDSYLKL